MAKAKIKVTEKEEIKIEEPTPKKPSKITWVGSVGRRKRSVARVRVWLEKNGKLTVNEKPVEEYFPGNAAKSIYEEPLIVANHLGQIAVSILVRGGGSQGQLHASAQGIANALVAFDEKLREPLAKKKLLTRDPREKERRKYGYAGKARARKQSPKR